MSIQPKFMVGIDPGVQTGFAVWRPDLQRLTEVESMAIHEAMDRLRALQTWSLLVVVEDARRRKWFAAADARQARSGAGVREGVGSVKRDCQILEHFLASLKMRAEFVKPVANSTKLSAEAFARITGWTSRTNNHARDAAMLVFGRKA